MIFHSLYLNNFRNYLNLEFNFHPQVTRIVGDNAQGKTNLLEALYFLSHGNSFRTAQRVDLIRYDVDTAIIRARASTSGLVDDYCAEIKRERNRFVHNGKAAVRPNHEWPYVILFAPEETLLFHGEPGRRRDYLDAFITGLDDGYHITLRNFRRVLQQRNRMLQQAEGLWSPQLRDQLVPWTEQLIEYGSAIVQSRRQWVEVLNACLPSVHGAFASGDGALQLVYLPSVGDAQEFRDRLAQRFEEEVARKMTVVGPQRDDCIATLAGVDLKHFGSQGQHRSVVISLKLVEVQLVISRRGRPPILLLDDVASELDPGRIDAFFAAIHGMQCQIIVSTVHVADRMFRPDAGSETITIHQGAVFNPPNVAISL